MSEKEIPEAAQKLADELGIDLDIKTYDDLVNVFRKMPNEMLAALCDLAAEEAIAGRVQPHQLETLGMALMEVSIERALNALFDDIVMEEASRSTIH